MQRAGLRLTLVGVAAQLTGFGIDAWMHIKDPTLAARETLLSIGNVGHVLIIVGTLVLLAGVVLAVAGTRLARMSRPAQVGIVVLLALVTGISTLAAANSSLAQRHDDASHASTSRPSHGHGSGIEHPYQPVNDVTRVKLAQQLTRARDVAERYATVERAEAAGYLAITPYLPLIGAHYMKFPSVDRTFDISEPEMLLFDGRSKTSRIVGLSYYVLAKAEPEGFAGPNDHWHRHIGLCIDTKNLFVIGNEQTTEEECRRRGGIKIAEGAEGAEGWMVHAWVVPGWESTRSVFSAENEQLR